MFVTSYIRPTIFKNLPALSDVTEDATPVLRLPDEALGVHEYSLLFPVGSQSKAYEDVIYFLPLACHFIYSNPDSALDLIDGLVHFVADCDAQLSHDDLKVEALTSFLSILDEWTNAFNIVHFNQQQMIAKGSPHPYYDYVDNSEEVFCLLEYLIRFSTDSQLAEYYVLHWCSQRHRNPESSGWFLEFCRHFSEDKLFCRNFSKDEFSWTTPMIESITTSRSAIQHHYRQLVNDRDRMRIPSTYLRDLGRALEIT